MRADTHQTSLLPPHLQPLRHEMVALTLAGRYRESLAVCNRLLLEVPENAAVWKVKVVNLGALQRYRAELRAARRAVALDPEDVKV